MNRHFCLAWALAGLSMACDPHTTQRAVYVAEAAQYAGELTVCRQRGAAVKQDGGDGYAAYIACACQVDQAHGLDAGGCQ